MLAIKEKPYVYPTATVKVQHLLLQSRHPHYGILESTSCIHSSD
jgi:hypothetical protein